MTTDDDTNISTVDPVSKSVLLTLRDRNPSLRKKWASTYGINGVDAADDRSHWAPSVTFDDAGRVTVLDLGGSRLQQQDLHVNLQPLTPDLTTLNLGATYLPATDVADVVREVTGLAHLLLGGNMLNDDDVTMITTAAASSSSLTKLDLRYNDVGPRGAAAVANLVSSLHELRLEGNQVGDAGAEVLATAMALGGTTTTTTTTNLLTSLHLGDNGIGPDGGRALAAALTHNVTLTRLFLEGNRLGPEGAQAMTTALATNTTLRHLYVDNNGIGQQASDALARVLNSDSVIGAGL